MKDSQDLDVPLLDPVWDEVRRSSHHQFSGIRNAARPTKRRSAGEMAHGLQNSFRRLRRSHRVVLANILDDFRQIVQGPLLPKDSHRRALFA